MHREYLILSWVDACLRFLRGKGGEVLGTWEHAGTLGDFQDGSLDLGELIKQATAELGYQGKTLLILLEHEAVSQQLLSTPPAKGRDLELYLERQVDQLKVIEGAVVMSWMETEPIKTSKGLVLYLFPAELQEKLIAATVAAGLHLMGVASPTAILRHQLGRLPIDEEAIVMLVAPAGEHTAAVIGRKDGAVFLARMLKSNGVTTPGRLHSDLNRSTIFLRQQYGKDVDSVWITGEEGDEPYRPWEGMEEGALEGAPRAAAPYFWGEKMLEWDPQSTANMVSEEQRNAPRRKLLLRVVTAAISVFFLVALGVTAVVEFHLYHAREKLQGMQEEKERLEEEEKSWLAKRARLAQDQEVAALVVDQTLMPVPGWFLSHVAAQLPAELVLTKVEVRRIDEVSGQEAVSKRRAQPARPATSPAQPTAPLPKRYWQARLEGVGLVTPEAPPEQVKEALYRFRESLTGGPYPLTLTDSTREFAPRSLEAWISPRGGAAKAGAEFYLEGLLGDDTSR